MLVENAGRILPMGTTVNGDLIAGVRLSQSDVFITDFSDPAGHAKRATLRFPGRNSGPSWSPDGKRLAYLSRRGGENFGEEARAIVIRTLDSEEERELNPKLAHIERVRWSPDGRALLVSGSDGKGRAGLFEVDAITGSGRVLVAEPGTGARGLEGVWSADRKYLYYLHGGTELRRRAAGTGQEAVIHTGKDLCCLTASGDRVAFVEDKNTVVAEGTKRNVPIDHLRDLEWGADLIADDGADLWLLPRSGAAPIRREMPGNRQPGFSLHPDGRTIAITAGKSLSEIRAIRVR
jgi:dipeptidyl aminopeptidase/acylaminoacyl peptidase